MKARRFWMIILALVFVAVLTLTAAGLLAPAVSTVMEQACLTVQAGDDCIRFPAVSGLSLSGLELMLPDDLQGDYALLLVPFDDDQQVLAGTWLEPAQILAEQYPSLTYYNAAVLPDLAPAVRVVVRVGMNALITDAHLRDVTITLFLADRDALLTALDIPSADVIQIFLLNGEGEVLWRNSGEYTPEKGKSLVALLSRVLAETS